MSLPVVILTHPLPPEWLSRIEGRVRLVVGPPVPPGFAPHLMDHIDVAEGILCLLTDRVDDELLKKAPRLKVVSNMAVGVDNINIAACTRRGIPVGNTPGVLTEATADLTMGLLLSIGRRIPESAQDARSGLWKTWSATGWLGADLDGAVLGIVGMGKIGQAVARRAAAFGLKILYLDPSNRPDIESDLKARRVDKKSLLAESDFLSLHCPLTPETRHFIDSHALQAMKPTSILVNAARGPVVDQAALQLALEKGWISGAALDVTDPEPLPAGHPLYHNTRCLIVPHIGSATHNTRRRMAEMACDNLLAGLEGQVLPNCVNPEIYR